MITKREKLTMTMAGLSFADCRDAWILRARLEAGRVVDARQWLLNNGLEAIDAQPNDLLTADGREVIWHREKPYALKIEIHNKRREDALAVAQEAGNKTETKSVVGTESLATLICPKCHDALQYSKVCPACAAGKAGYDHRYICVCGVDFVTKELL